MRFAALPIVLTLMLSASTRAADKPKLTLKANPVMAMSPARVVVNADLAGGANDQQLYCLAVEWEWGDGTRSEDAADCDPFNAAKSEIKRHFIGEHVFRMEEPGGAGQQPEYRDVHVQLRLKKNGKVVVSGGTTVKIKPEMGH